MSQQILEILAANKKTAIVALITAILVTIVILAIQALSRKKPSEET